MLPACAEASIAARLRAAWGPCWAAFRRWPPPNLNGSGPPRGQHVGVQHALPLEEALVHQLQKFEGVLPVDRFGRNPVDLVARFGGGLRERCVNLPAQ